MDWRLCILVSSYSLCGQVGFGAIILCKHFLLWDFIWLSYFSDYMKARTPKDKARTSKGKASDCTKATTSRPEPIKRRK